MPIENESVLQCEVCGRRSDQPDPRPGASRQSIRWFRVDDNGTQRIACGGPSNKIDECLGHLLTRLGPPDRDVTLLVRIPNVVPHPISA